MLRPGYRLSRFFPSGKGRYLQAGAERELFQDIMHMAFDGKSGDVQGLGDFLVAEAFGDQIHDFTFPMRELDRVGGQIFTVGEG